MERSSAMTHTQSTLRNPFGAELKRWRSNRGKSQLELSMISGYSQRHLSFLESGRSQPSRATVITLAEALDIPVKERNGLLFAAGFAPVYSSESLDSQRLHPAIVALETLVQSHRPFPAIVVDRGWNAWAGNDNAFALFQRFLDRPLITDPSQPLNVMRACIEPDGIRRYIVDWHAFAAMLLVHLRHELVFEGDNADLRSLVAAIESDPEFSDRGREAVAGAPMPVSTMRLERDGICIDLFTLISTFATPNDATLSELRVETFFPANETSRAFLLALDADLNASNPARAGAPPVALWRRAG
jgi:transcriptional regulator with XRE-family HTH domain